MIFKDLKCGERFSYNPNIENNAEDSEHKPIEFWVKMVNFDVRDYLENRLRGRANAVTWGEKRGRCAWFYDETEVHSIDKDFVL